MQEREVRLLFEKGYVAGANVVFNSAPGTYNIVLFLSEKNAPSAVLSAKRGGVRTFKTADAALSWCHEMGFDSVKVQFNYSVSELDPPQSASSTDILLIEDNEDDIVLTMRAFESHSISNNIVIKRDGEEALNYLFEICTDAKMLPGLILLDIHLPKVSGLEVLRKIRQHPHTRLIPVVILTTSDEARDVYEGYKCGTNSYLRKPVNFEAFVNIINQVGQYWLCYNVPPPAN